MNIVGPVIRRDNMYTGIPVTDKMLMTLWCLANRESFRVLSRRFGLNRGNIHYSIENLGKLLLWPVYLLNGHQLIGSFGRKYSR